MQILKDFIEKNRDRKDFREHEVKGLLRELGFPVPKGIFLDRESSGINTDEAGISFPLVAKVSSSKIVSKSEVKGLRIGLKNESELNRAVSELLQIKDAEGVLIEELAEPGVEIILGGIVDDQFGPVVMFGLGGIFVELFKDVAFAMAPAGVDDALRLIKQVKGYRLLGAYRGRTPIDMDALLRMIVDVSELMATGLIKEIDLNPVSLYPKGVMVLDAKLTVF